MNQKEAEAAENQDSTYIKDEGLVEEQDSDQTEAVDNNEEEQIASEPELEYVEKSKFEEVQQKADENYQRFLRAQADLDNFRRRTRSDKEEAAKYASMKLIEQLLPVIDNFERALASSQSNADYDSLVKGIEMISRQISQAVEQEGLKAIEAVGQPFNPDFHEAIMQVESEEHEEGIIVEEVQKGYMLKDRVLRPTMVKVSQ